MPTQELLKFAGILLAIIIVDLALSGDNALVIGSVAARLKGKQRRQAILLGGAFAAVLRIALSIFAVFLLTIPFIEAIGGLVVFVISAQMLHEIIVDLHRGGQEEPEEHGSRRVRRQLTGDEKLFRASITILIADFSMSLDNVLAIAALAQHYWQLLVIGLLLSVLLLLLASSLIARIIERFPLLMYAAAGILAWTAGSMVLQDKQVGAYVHYLDQFVPGPLPDYIAPLFLLVLIGIGIFFTRQERQRTLTRTLTTPASQPR